MTKRGCWLSTRTLLTGDTSAGAWMTIGVKMLNVDVVNGPVFVDQQYSIDSEIVGLSESRRTESYWTRTSVTDVDTGTLAAVVLLHSGMFKESYAGYPKKSSTT